MNPTNWPYVRRGTERFMNELAGYLGRRGHEVRIISSKPGRPEILQGSSYVIDYRRSLWFPALARLGILDFHVFPLTTIFRLLGRRYDVVHCFNFTDALVASLGPWRRGARIVLHLTSMPPEVRYRRSVSVGGGLLRTAIHAADAVLTVGTLQQRYFEDRFGRKCITIPAPVDLAGFPLCCERDQRRPVILCASAVEDRRKGGRVLMRAFNCVKEARPEVRLQISSQCSPEIQTSLLGLVDPRWRPDVHFLGAGELSELPRLLGAASAVVVPSLWETFPMVLLESLATGTPVVGTAKTGSEEIIQHGTGRIFDPGPPDGAEPSNADGLAAALLETLELSRLPETPLRCRALVEQFAWEVLGPRYEEAIVGSAEGRH